jgi:hypothetical protein
MVPQSFVALNEKVKFPLFGYKIEPGFKILDVKGVPLLKLHAYVGEFV